MDIRKWARILGWAVASYAGGGILLTPFSPLILTIIGPLLPSGGVACYYFGVPLIFAFISVFHDLTGKLVRINHALRRSSACVLWVFAFYLATIAIALLGFVIPYAGPLVLLIALAPVAGGVAGSLCWRGKLPGSGKHSTANASDARKGEKPAPIPQNEACDPAQAAVGEIDSGKSG